MDREELIKRFVSLEFNTFLTYYENAPDLNDSEHMKRVDTRGKRRDDENMSRFFVNIGRKDKLNPARLIGLINDQNIAKNIEIGQIEILDTFSFFELDKTFESETVSAFQENNVDFEGRSVNVEITKKERSGGGSGSRRGGKKPFGNKDGGFGRRRSDDRGKRKSENRSSDRPDRNSGDRQSGGFGRRRRER